ncbi:MAG: tetratricopeptide repeat protein [Coriobacteriaceae bacterium]|nr:tetratricopeptide repeat protein [Coriobacteriaceae bacterium]
MTGTSKINQLISGSRLAFLNQQNETALNLAKQAIALEPKHPDAHKCAADACMSLARYDEAIKSYEVAVKCDPLSGDRHYELGYALTTAGKQSAAISTFAKAEELGCSTENLTRVYFLMGAICFDIGRYEDALANLAKAEAVGSPNPEILQRKAVIHGILNEIPKGIQAANQIKMLSPADYRGYQIAYKLLVQAGRIEDAAKELEKAGRYVSPVMAYYEDRADFELQRFKRDEVKEHLDVALALIEEGFKAAKPTLAEVINGYRLAATIYIQLENPDRAIDCLNAAQNPIWSYNNGFAVVASSEGLATLTEYDVEDMIAADRERIAEELGEHGLEELVESTEMNEDGSRDYLTEYLPNEEGASQEDAESYRLDEAAQIPLTTDDIDEMHGIYMDAYLMKKDFKKVIDHARQLQESNNPSSNYLGRLNEALALLAFGSPDAERKCEEAKRFFRNAMIKDATDLLAITFRIQLCLETGGYDEAEEICGLLAKEVREPLLKQIEELKSGGD